MQDKSYEDGVELPKDGGGRENFGKRGEAENTSIGTGSSDQGLEPGTELAEDDIRAMEEETLESKHEDLFGKGGEGTRPAPTHGLVEEGPGPDA